MNSNKSYLALGDSYTIGEGVALPENFPHQTVAILNNGDNEYHFSTPEIIATTGWTTDELNVAIDVAGISTTYDIVSLLIGVNNQYRGRDVKNFETEFENLLQRAIYFAGNKSNHVFVLSIPDWSVTPFAAGKDVKNIAEEIDAYNKVCKSIAGKLHAHYIEITASQRTDGNKNEFLAADLLHPSANEYKKWAILLATAIKDTFNIQ
jgi:lysophospholipase L1-like esterase